MIDFSSDISYSFHNYGEVEEKIDYIYGSQDIKCKHTEVWSDCVNQVYLSDHYPICIDVVI